MLKSELVTLVNALRAENSTLRTQLDAKQKLVDALRADRDMLNTRSTTRSVTGIRAACQRLKARHPGRRSFTDAEVMAEAACSA